MDIYIFHLFYTMPVILEDDHIKINDIEQFFDDVSDTNLNTKLKARAGINVSIDDSGVISSTISSATSSLTGGIKVGDNLTINDDGVLSGLEPLDLSPYRLISDSYTKAQVDERDTNTSNVISTRINNLPSFPSLTGYRLISDSYTKAEVDGRDTTTSNVISTRINNLPSFPSLTGFRLNSDSYTQAQVDERDTTTSNVISARINNLPSFPSLTGFRLNSDSYTKAEVDGRDTTTSNVISARINNLPPPLDLLPYRLISNSYTKAEVDGRDTTTSNVISARINNLPEPDLSPYRLISNSYTKAQVDGRDTTTSNVISTRINNLNIGSVPTVANVFPLLNNSHFEQISDGSSPTSPNNISIKNINSSGRFDYEYLNIPPILTTNIIVPILEPISSPSVAKITINSEYKYMSFTYKTPPPTPYTITENNTPYTITFNENTECDILIVGGGGAGGNAIGGGGGAGGVVYAINQQLNGTYNIGVGKGGLGLDVQGGIGEILAHQNGADSFIRNDDNTADISLNMGGTSQYLRGFGGGTGGVHHASLNNGVNGGSGGGSSEHIDDVANIAGTSIQPNTYWNGTSYIKGGNAGNTNKAGNEFYIAGGGGGLGAVSNSFLYGYVNGRGGLSINITGTPQSYAAGGGGGQYLMPGALVNFAVNIGIGGSSIGGNGRIFNSDNNTYLRDPTNGIDGTGSGGGGGAFYENPLLEAGSGGSGIVIIRYKYLKIITSIQQTRFLNYTTVDGWNVNGLEQNAIIKSLSDRIASLGG